MMREPDAQAENPHDSEGAGTCDHEREIDARHAQSLADVGDPDQARPKVLGGVQAENQQGVFGRKGGQAHVGIPSEARLSGSLGDLILYRYFLPIESDATGARPEIVKAKVFGIDGIEIRKQRPLQLEHILSAGAVERALVTRSQPEPLNRGSELL